MNNFKFIYVLFTVMALLPSVVVAQIPSERDASQIPLDNIKSEKNIEPDIRLWQLTGFGAFRDSLKLDTLQDHYHLYHPVFKNAVTAGYVGNYGTPYQNNDFFSRDSKIDFLFLRSREAYLLTPGNVIYYNTKTPYTLLDYTQSEHRTRKNETRFNVLHTQNVNPYLNFTLRFDQARSAGQYKNQASKSNFFTLYSNYNDDKFSIHGGFITNKIQNDENGGLTDDDLIFDGADTDFLNVNLTSTRSQFSSNYFFATGEYRLGKYKEPDAEDIPEDDEMEVVPEFRPMAGLMYSFEYQSNVKEFIDQEDTTNMFFPETYYDLDYEKDSIRFRVLKNIIQIKQYENPDRKLSFGKRIFLGQEHISTSLPGPYAEYFRKRKNFSNIYAGGGVFREGGQFWTWNAEGKIYLLGRNIGQTELSGTVSKPLSLLGDSLISLNINGEILNLVPEYFQEEFYSNHSRWNNNLKMEQRMRAGGSLSIPRRKLELSANYAVINNFIYNDTLGIPVQDDGQILVLSAFVDKDFNYRNLHFRTRLLWQKASNEEIIHLPDFSTFISAYYKFVISKVLYTQIGLDTRYNTSYYADAYDPSTGMFHLQKDLEIGGYPYLDAYVSLRLKRTRLFFKMINLGTEFIDKAYFTVPHYPMNRRTFRFGVNWSFYD
ncbi:MAG: putative porin [Prolixibacteraceae bacterium]|nr:putative porin [Prolixibacteraceae bacterium]